MKTLPPLVVLETHPVQYHAPVYRALQQECGVPVTVLYGSDFSVIGYRDAEFETTFAWDTDLLSGYDARFLERTAEGGAPNVGAVTGRGVHSALRELQSAACLLTGYHGPFHRNALRAARATGRPILFRAESTDHARERGIAKGWLRDQYLKWLYRQCAVLLPIGQQARQHYRRLAPGKPQILSPYCVALSPFRPTEHDRGDLRGRARAALGLSDEHIALLFSGKLIAAKDPELLVRTIKALPQSLRARIRLLFLGDGPMRGDLEALARETPEVAATFLGFQNQNALSPYYHAADLLVLPSRSETWGLVVNEALHHGLPSVVSTRVGSAPDLIRPGETGELFESASLESLAAALERALPLAGDSAIRARCREQVAPYSVQQAAAGIAAAYRQVVPEGQVG